jgi:nitrogen fixation protein FixH
MELSDLRYGQRSLEKKSTNQNMLVNGDNKISITIVDKENNTPVTNANVKFQITRAIADMYDINLDKFKLENNTYATTAKIDKDGNWNIIAKITVGDDIGYLYIKTNTQK